MSIIGHIYQAVSGGAVNSVQPEPTLSLITTDRHSPLLARRRALVILSRIRLMAIIGAILFPVGIIFDALTFEAEIFRTLAIGRIVAAALLVTLLISVRKRDDIFSAYRALAIFFATLLVFEAFYHPIVLPNELASITGVMTTGYALFPFLMITCLAVFPLTLKESFLTLVLFFIAELLILILIPEHINPLPRLGILMSLLAVGLLATFSSISQLHYMVSLVDQASVDTLTDCYSRNSGEEILDVQFRISKRQDLPMTLIFMDLDSFKTVNDDYGHEAGDAVLRTAATTVRDGLRDSDVMIRWGGDEFVMFLPNTDVSGALKAIRRLRHNGLGLRPDGSELTASFGISERQGDNISDWHELVDLADTRMYLAKSQGGNAYMTGDATGKVASV